MTKSGIVGAIGILLLFRSLAAQMPPAPAFEVASVKPNKSGIMRINTAQGGAYRATLSLLQLIRQAYQVERPQVVGGPGWLTSDLFDVDAKASEGLAAAQMPLLLRALLAERFKLAVHMESREGPLFALVLARKDGRLGPQLRPATVDCAARPAKDDGGPACAPRIGSGFIRIDGQSMPQFITLLQPVVGQRVIDRTGLVGRYDISLVWTPEDPGGPSFFTVIREQLGLKLESQKGEGTVLVVDHAEHPRED